MVKDKVICINNIAVNQFYPNGVVIDGLTLHKVYSIEEYEKVDGDVAIWIIDDNNQYYAYFKNYFMDLDKWREEQLKKILNNN